MPEYGLIGKNIAYSFSKSYFMAKFQRAGLPYSYENFDLENIGQLHQILLENPELKGLNVTIPYKEAVMPLLDSISGEAIKIGAVNTIKIDKEGKLHGHNTDHFGFEKALSELLPLKKKHRFGPGYRRSIESHTIRFENPRFRV